MIKYSKFNLIKIIFIILIHNLSHAQTQDSLSQKDYQFQLLTINNHPVLPRNFIPIHTVKLSTPLYDGYEYKISFFISDNIPIQWNSGYRSYPVKVFPTSTFFKELSKNSDSIVKSSSFFPSYGIGVEAKFKGTSHYDFKISPDKPIDYLTVALEDVPYTNPNFNVRNGVFISSIFVELLGEAETYSDNIAQNQTKQSNLIRTLINKGKDIIVTDSLVTIEIYDHKKIDGDIVSIYINDDIIVQKEVLTRDKKSYEVILRQNQNQIILHAENLGEEPPNTLAIRIKTRNEEYEKILSSDMHHSEYFNLILEE